MTIHFSWSQFLWITFIFVGVPSMFGALLLWSRSSKRNESMGTGCLGLWATGLLAFVFGFASCAGWLSWSAEQRGEFRGPGLPAPIQFNTSGVASTAESGLPMFSTRSTDTGRSPERPGRSAFPDLLRFVALIVCTAADRLR
ncbi:hypothetical protein ABIB34_003743 [Rhodococcus sp. UYP5]